MEITPLTHRAVEKAARLTADKVPLGRRAAPAATPAPEPAAQPAAPSPAALLARIAELEAALAQSEQRLGATDAELTASRDETAALRAELAERDEHLAAAQAQAEQRGYAEGNAAAEETAAAERQQLTAHWQAALADLQQQVQAHNHARQADIIELTLAATARVIGERLADAASIEAAVIHLIRESGLDAPLKALLAPAHYEALAAAGASCGDGIELRPDARITHGGCLLETAEAVVDGRFDLQLQRLALLLRETAVATPR